MTAHGFSLTKFKSNSLPDKHERSTSHLETDKEQVERTLGVGWRAIDDCFTFTKNIKLYNMTK